MQCISSVALLLCLIAEVWSVQRITLDDDAQALCKKYKMMCKANKICAVQHFDWPNNITIPVCIPLSFVPAEYSYHVRNMICQLPPDIGRCHARYIRWYFNIHSQECNHFQYGGCEGNQNNFMSKTDCERHCIATPSIKLYEEGSNSALVQPSILTAPIYEPQKTNQYEALNSVMEPVDGNFDRNTITRHRPNRVRSDEAIRRTRRRLDKEKEKEKRRERRRKEKRRLRKLEKREQKKLRCKKRREKGKKCKKDRRNKKDKKKNVLEKKEVVENDVSEVKNNVVPEDTNQVAKETKAIISNEIAAASEDDKSSKEAKRERRRRKRKLREKRKLEKERNRRNLNSKYSRRYSELVKSPDSYSSKLFSILDQEKQYREQKNSLLHTLS